MDDAQPPNGDADQPNHPAASGSRSRPRNPRHPRNPRRPRDIGRGITTAAVVIAAVAGAGAIGVVAGLLTLFGWGLAIVAAILAVGVAAAIQPRPANGWLLVPVLALAIPAAAVAVSGVRVLPQRGAVVEAPTTAAQVPDDGYQAGIGDLLVDLRSLDADDGDRITVRAGSDLGRTVVALSRHRCFNLDVRWRAGNLRLPRVREQRTVTGFRPRNRLDMLGQQGPYHRKRFGMTRGRIALFGRAYGDDEGRWVAPAAYEDAPTLTLDLTSEGGSFVVRDYPDDVAPLRATDWPVDQLPPPFPAFVRRQALRRELERMRRDLPHPTRPRPARATSTTHPRPARATVTASPVGPTPTAVTPTATAATPSTTAGPTPTAGTPTATAATPTTTAAAPTAAAATATTTTAAPGSTTATPPHDATVAPTLRATRPAATRPGARSSKARRALRPREIAMIDRQARAFEASIGEARRWQRLAKRRQAFARRWAERVAGACNPRGSFR